MLFQSCSTNTTNPTPGEWVYFFGALILPMWKMKNVKRRDNVLD